MNVLFLLGSLRDGSTNRTLAEEQLDLQKLARYGD